MNDVGDGVMLQLTLVDEGGGEGGDTTANLTTRWNGKAKLTQVDGEGGSGA